MAFINYPSTLPGSPVAGTIAIDSAASNALKWYNGSQWLTPLTAIPSTVTASYFTTGSTVEAFGAGAGENIKTNSGTVVDNTFVGFNAGADVGNGGWTRGSSNTAVGDSAMSLCVSIDSSVAVGAGALQGGASTDSIGCVAVGSQALQSLTTSDYNTAIGYIALLALTTGDYNTALGSQAGDGFNHIQSTFLGASTDGTAAVTNSIAIGYSAIAQRNAQVAIGNHSSYPVDSAQFGVSVRHEFLQVATASTTAVPLTNPTTGTSIAIADNQSISMVVHLSYSATISAVRQTGSYLFVVAASRTSGAGSTTVTVSTLGTGTQAEGVATPTPTVTADTTNGRVNINAVNGALTGTPTVTWRAWVQMLVT